MYPEAAAQAVHLARPETKNIAMEPINGFNWVKALWGRWRCTPCTRKLPRRDFAQSISKRDKSLRLGKHFGLRVCSVLLVPASSEFERFAEYQ